MLRDTLREKYIEHACCDNEVQRVMTVQLLFGPERWPVLSRYYFNIWTHLGSGPFYVLLLCIFAWSGYPFFAAYMCFSLSIALYTTDIIKDALACPRPPSPPVYRGGQASHALEYGFPSTHTACACVLAHLVAGFLLETPQQHILYEFPSTIAATGRSTTVVAATTNVNNNAATGAGFSAHASLYSLLFSSSSSSSTSATAFGIHPGIVLFGAVVFVLHVAVSRMYLGLHWFGDILGGLAVYFAWAVSDALFLRHSLMWLFSLSAPFESAAQAFASPATATLADWLVFVAMLLAPLLVGVWLLEAHTTPRDACPCFEDSARFVGADCGLLIGSWLIHLDHRVAQLSATVFHVDPPLVGVSAVVFVLTYLCGVVASVGSQEATVRLLPALLRPVLRFLSGQSRMPIPALQAPYRFFCSLVGLLVFLRRPSWLSWCSMTATTATSNEQQQPEQQKQQQTSPTTATSDGQHQSAAVNMMTSNDAAGDTEGGTSPSKPPGSSGMTAVVDIFSDGSTATSVTANENDQQQQQSGIGVWSLRCHTHWDEEKIQAKFLSYVVLGWCASYLFPILIVPGVRASWSEMTSKA